MSMINTVAIMVAGFMIGSFVTALLVAYWKNKKK